MSYKDPSDAQLRYAKTLGLSIPEGATRWQVTDVIDIGLGCDRWAPDWLKDYASAKAVKYFNKLEPISEKRLMRLIFAHLEPESAAAWFSFWVYRDIVGGKNSKLLDPDNEVFRETGRKILSDPRLITSIKGYTGHPLLHFGTWDVPDGCNMEEGGSRRTIAYKTTASLLSERVDVPLRKNKAETAQGISQRTAAKQQKQESTGCLSVVVMVAVLFTGIAWFTTTLLI